jgi:hypothetical protein
MSALWFVLVVAIILVTRLAGQAGVLPMGPMRSIGVLGGIVLMIMLVVQCMTASEGVRGGRRHRHGHRAVNRVLHGGRGGWTGYVPWWLYPSYSFPWGGWSGWGWSPYPDPYPPGYGPNAYLPRPWNAGPCAQGCMADQTGSYGCPYPGYYPGQCRFASDCQGCAPGGVPAVVY